MQSNYKPPFKTFLKKQRPPFQLAIEDQVEDICANSDIGEQKTGDLAGIWVHKFNYLKKEYLIAYRPPTQEMREEDGVDLEILIIDFYQAGPHENFYRDLKNYLKS